MSVLKGHDAKLYVWKHYDLIEEGVLHHYFELLEVKPLAMPPFTIIPKRPGTEPRNPPAIGAAE